MDNNNIKNSGTIIKVTKVTVDKDGRHEHVLSEEETREWLNEHISTVVPTQGDKDE